MAAHVDAGKTTLSEALLFEAGEIRKQGRVDNGDAFLDNNSQERERGITIFSKQALLRLNGAEFTLIDTPGHADFAADAERAFAVSDCAVLVISGIDGVQSRTRTILGLLERAELPVFTFVNKMDIARRTKTELMDELCSLDRRFADFSENIEETSAEFDEDCMNCLLDSGEVPDEKIATAIKRRKIFPVMFGSALKNKSVGEFGELLVKFAEPKEVYGGFAAQVFKISADKNGVRETFIKINGGEIRVRQELDGEKISRLGIYNGAKFIPAEAAEAGQLCAVTGLSRTFAGQCFGEQKPPREPSVRAALSYKVMFDSRVNTAEAYSKLKILEQEDPQLRFSLSQGEIQAEVMGEIQCEILQNIIKERFGLFAAFGEGRISYKETITERVEGVGHFEPLRHYAEVHLLIEPLPRGSGVVFSRDCRDLDENWQRLIMSHLRERRHIGVLTGSPITDVKITLRSGKAHLKHTEGGDFREATYRAVRQGLASASSQLLEPFYEFSLEIPQSCVGRALTDLQRMGAEFSSPQTVGESALIEGICPVSEMQGYQRDVIGYTRGEGRLSCGIKGYFPCHNAEDVIEKIGYDFNADVENTADSVFCSHGAGHLVKWDEVPEKMHLESILSKPRETTEAEINSYKSRAATDKELMEIFERTYGKIKRKTGEKSEVTAMRRDKQIENSGESHKQKNKPLGEEYLLVDGYNIIFAWDELKEIAARNLDSARVKLISIMCNYQAFRRCNLILVFDAYRVKSDREIETVGGITVVYTKEAETADAFIEKTAHYLGKSEKDNRVRVATNDGLEQLIIIGGGAQRVSAEILRLEVDEVEKSIRKILEKHHK
ncbi:MAG: TetM/TetW/TetO/TetS family tetracycline resistance ribosomal protection protein [Oscillospiraceae bacterium]|nr:TetM/TetW/TetO/TetS family tetracycline resistance ribosomal protection protein [Oscillospiraceae bacterium]